MITNESRLLSDTPDGLWIAGFFVSLVGLMWGTTALFTGDYIWTLSFLAPLLYAVGAFLLMTGAAEQLEGVRLTLFKSYRDAPEQVRSDLGPLTAKQISQLSTADADRVLSALRSLQGAYNKHSEAVPDSRVAVLLDNAKTAEQAYKELTSTGA